MEVSNKGFGIISDDRDSFKVALHSSDLRNPALDLDAPYMSRTSTFGMKTIVCEDEDAVSWLTTFLKSNEDVNEAIILDKPTVLSHPSPLPILHWAIFHKSDVAVNMIMEAGGDITKPNSQNWSVLHSAVQFNWPEGIQILLEYGADINARDESGQTALQLCVNVIPARAVCANHLLQYGALMDKTTFLELLYKYPQLPYESSLNQGISSMPVPEVSDHTMRLNFNLDPFINDIHRGDGHVPYQYEISMLNEISASKRQDLLKHPLCQLFLQIKWLLLRRLFYFTFILLCIHVIFTSHVVIRRHNEHNTNHSSNATVIYQQEQRVWDVALVLMSNILLTLVVFLKIHHEKLSSVYSPFNLLSTIQLGISYHMMLYYLRKYPNMDPGDVRILEAVLILVGYLSLLVVGGKLPNVGIYKAMLVAVLNNIAKVTMIYMFAILGFSLSFYILYEPFSGSTANSFFMTFVMMYGDLFYAHIFNDMGPGKISFIAHLLLILFLMLIIVSSFNLIIGLSVSDIRSMYEDSHLTSLKHKIYLISVSAGFVNVMKKIFGKCIRPISKMYPDRIFSLDIDTLNERELIYIPMRSPNSMLDTKTVTYLKIIFCFIYVPVKYLYALLIPFTGFLNWIRRPTSSFIAQNIPHHIITDSIDIIISSGKPPESSSENIDKLKQREKFFRINKNSMMNAMGEFNCEGRSRPASFKEKARPDLLQRRSSENTDISALIKSIARLTDQVSTLKDSHQQLLISLGKQPTTPEVSRVQVQRTMSYPTQHKF